MLKWATTGKSAPQTSFYLFFPENITVVRSNARSGSFSRMKTKIYRNFCLSLWIGLPVFIFLPALHQYLYWSLCIVFTEPVLPTSLQSDSCVSSHLLSVSGFFGFGLSRTFSPSIPASMRLRPTSDSSSTQINFLKPHLILLHIHTRAHTLSNGSLAQSWKPNLVLTR